MPASRRRRTLGALAALSLAAAGCGSSSSGHHSAAPHGGGGGGEVVVLSAGSLQSVLTKSVGPAFEKATGYRLDNTSMGSSDLAAEIKDKVVRADVFVSASPAINQTLEGRANGSWVDWYASFATSPVVLGYYPKSRFASALRSRPWYDVVTEPGFLVGRTNPTQDPGGVLAVKILDAAATAKHLPALAALAHSGKDEYQETALQGDVADGQVDGAFMYEADARSDDLPFVPLTGVATEDGDYTITVLERAPHTAAGAAFVKFLLGSTGSAELRADRFGIIAPPKVTGSGVPGALRPLLAG